MVKFSWCTQEIAACIADMKSVFHIPLLNYYTVALTNMTCKWSAPFHQYYMTHIHPDIESIARWGIEPDGVYNPFSGVTNNQAEGFNHVLKSLQEWKELSLNYLQMYYSHEIERGKQALGEYSSVLHHCFQKVYIIPKAS